MLGFIVLNHTLVGINIKPFPPIKVPATSYNHNITLITTELYQIIGYLFIHIFDQLFHMSVRQAEHVQLFRYSRHGSFFNLLTRERLPTPSVKHYLLVRVSYLAATSEMLSWQLTPPL